MNYPTLDDIIRLNCVHVSQTPGEEYIPPDNLFNRNSLEWVLEVIQDSSYYPTIADKAARLAWIIIKGHVFWGGNKRTGLSALEAFLRRNGYELDASNNELFRIALQIAGEDSLTYDTFLEWLKNRITRSV